MKAMFANAYTTIIGILLGGVTYLAQSPIIPTTKADVWHLAQGAFLAALGIAAKDATTGSRPPSVQ